MKFVKTRHGNSFVFTYDREHFGLANILSSFRQREEFIDAKFASKYEPHKILKGHRVLLSAVSNFLYKKFKGNPNPNDVVLLELVEHTQLTYFLQLLYDGSVTIPQKDLIFFNATLRALNVKLDLNELDSDEEIVEESSFEIPNIHQPPPNMSSSFDKPPPSLRQDHESLKIRISSPQKANSLHNQEASNLGSRNVLPQANSSGLFPLTKSPCEAVPTMKSQVSSTSESLAAQMSVTATTKQFENAAKKAIRCSPTSTLLETSEQEDHKAILDTKIPVINANPSNFIQQVSRGDSNLLVQDFEGPTVKRSRIVEPPKPVYKRPRNYPVGPYGLYWVEAENEEGLKNMGNFSRKLVWKDESICYLGFESQTDASNFVDNFALISRKKAQPVGKFQLDKLNDEDASEVKADASKTEFKVRIEQINPQWNRQGFMRMLKKNKVTFASGDIQYFPGNNQAILTLSDREMVDRVLRTVQSATSEKMKAYLM